MSNYIQIIPTNFVNTRTGETEKGVRISDNYDQTYVDLEGIPDDDLDLLRTVQECAGPVGQAILDHVFENPGPIFIGNVEYSWDEIKDCLLERRASPAVKE